MVVMLSRLASAPATVHFGKIGTVLGAPPRNISTCSCVMLMLVNGHDTSIGHAILDTHHSEKEAELISTSNTEYLVLLRCIAKITHLDVY